ncbi:MAG: CBS domain-containing protein [Lentisphaeria bacterium]|jgi:CBS domain-containing protein
MRVAEYCNRNVVIIEDDQTPLEAALATRECHSGDVVVVRREGLKTRPIGIVTDRDIAIEIVAENVDPQEVAVEDVLYRPLIIIDENEDLAQCIKLMKRKAVRRLPVVDGDGSLVGIISEDDIIEVLTEDISDPSMLFNSPPIREKL